MEHHHFNGKINYFYGHVPFLEVIIPLLGSYNHPIMGLYGIHNFHIVIYVMGFIMGSYHPIPMMLNL